MSEWNSKAEQIIDCHVHMGGIDGEATMEEIRRATGISRISLVAIQDPAGGGGLPQALYMKARTPGVYFVFAGLNHAEQRSGGEVKTATLADQATAFAGMGCDGIKMIEGKPTSRQVMDIPVTDAYFAEYWERVEELGTPIVWHVNDPEEFWDPELIPDWAKTRNWGYGPEDVAKEQLYTEVDEVLARHPRLKVVFAHFYFLSADLPRAARFFDEHPTVSFDLAPGIEMLYNISRDPGEGREFFTKYADRIVFGTDLSSGWTIPESIARAGIVYRWLESDDEFRVPDTVDYLLGSAADGVIRGMSLPDDVLQRIYRANFVEMVGAEPKTLDKAAARAECEKLAGIAEAMSGKPAAETEAAGVAQALSD